MPSGSVGPEPCFSGREDPQDGPRPLRGVQGLSSKESHVLVPKLSCLKCVTFSPSSTRNLFLVAWASCKFIAMQL